MPGVKEEELSPPPPVHAKQTSAADVPCTAAVMLSTVKASKSEDKLEVVKGKRHRRQRTQQQETIIKEEEKKVCIML